MVAIEVRKEDDEEKEGLWLVEMGGCERGSLRFYVELI